MYLQALTTLLPAAAVMLRSPSKSGLDANSRGGRADSERMKRIAKLFSATSYVNPGECFLEFLKENLRACV
jgi:hypothetical protein